MGSLVSPKIQRIAIVGGGPSGICAAKYLLAENTFARIQIFEQSGTVQGAWKHTPVETLDDVDVPQINPYQPLPKPKNVIADNGGPTFITPMYDTLETNIPHQLMGFADKPFPLNSALYPPREEVSKYLEEYAEDVRHLVSFHNQVQNIRFIGTSFQDLWLVTTQDLLTGDNFEAEFDAVVICSGHYDLPYIPDVPGITNWNKAFPDNISHSKFYRNPSSFTGQKVIIVGNSASGMDIANQIAQVSANPLLVSQRSTSWLSGSNSKSEESRLTVLPQIVEYLDPTKHNRAVRFADGRVECDIDKILYCTGYLYSFPFLSDFLEEIIEDGARVHNIYKFIFFTKHPSLAFVGLPIRILPFPLAEAQAAVIAKIFSEQLSLPSLADMRLWEDQTVRDNGDGKKFLILDKMKDFLYHNDLYDWANEAKFRPGYKPKRWSREDFWHRSKFPEIKKAYIDHGEARYDIKRPEQLGFVYDETQMNNHAV